MTEALEQVCEKAAAQFVGSTGFGIDAVNLPKFKRCIDRGGSRFLARMLRPTELAEAGGAVPRLASRVAAKEALSKALGTGLRGVGWLDIEVLTNADGAPSIALHGRARELAVERGAHEIAVSLSHDEDFAFAAVIIGSNLKHGEMEI